MSYNYKDIYRILIPGITLYFLLMFVFQNPFNNFIKVLGVDKSNYNVFYVFFIPIIGFVLGFVNNFLSAFVEKVVSYRIYRRPSLRLLRNRNKFVKLSKDVLSKVFSNASIKESIDKIDNKSAYRIFSLANQSITGRPEMVETNYNYMVLARNMRLPMAFTFSELFITLVSSGKSVCNIIFLAIISAFFLLFIPWCIWQWYSMQHTKYIFVEYAKVNHVKS